MTSTYLTNANFSQGTPIDNGICTYGKDMAGNNTTYYGPQEISGWTNASVGATDEGYANSKLAGGLFAYGGTPFLGGAGFTAPATDPDENAGNALGILAVWGGTIQYTQDVTLPAGSYTLRFKTYNATNENFGSGKFITTNLFGFVADGGATYFAPSKTFAIGQWSTIAVTFNLTEETSGKISVGYVGPEGGGKMPHLFVDNVKILKNTYYENVTSKVGVKAAKDESNPDWINSTDGMQGNGVTTYDGRSTKMAARYGTSAVSEEVIYQNITGLKKGTYEAVVFAYSQNEWNNNGASLTHDAGDVGYVLADGKYTVKEWINARRGPGYPADGPGIYSLSGIEVDDNGELTLGFALAKANQTEWHAIQIKSLIYTKNLDLTAMISSYNSTLSEAKSLYNGTNKMGSAVKNSLKNTIDTYDEGKVDQTDSEPLEAAIDALREAIANANASINSYAALLTAITNANNHTIYTPVFEASATIYTNAVSTAQGVYDAAEVDDCAAAITALENGIHSAYENDYTIFKDDYAYDYSTLLNQDMTQWDQTDYVTMTADQHWNGEKGQSYYEQSGSDWGSNSWEHNASETATLPAGKYVMSITARASADVTSTMKVQVGNSEAITVTLPNKGAEGRGITTAGVGSYADGTYANSNKGGGWEYRFIAFEVAEESPVTISFSSSTNKIYNWVSLAAPLLKGNVHPNQIKLNQVASLVTTLTGYEQQISATTYATFADHISAANNATLESTDLDDIITNLQADIETAKAEVAALAALQTALEGANAVDQNAKMNGEVLTALQNAIASAVNVAPADLTTVTATLTTATSNATASIANYAEAKALLDAANSYDNAGQASYAANETIAAIQSAYNDGTLVAVTDEQKADAQAALDAACKAQTQPNDGCDMTPWIANWDFLNCQKDNFPNWTISKSAGYAQAFSTTAAEYWIGTAANGGFDFYQNVTNLPTGVYTVQGMMWNSTDNESNAAGVNGQCGVYGKSSNGEKFAGVTVDTRDGGKYTYTTEDIMVIDGNLRLGVKNNETMGGRWFGVDWIKLTYVRQLSDEEVEAIAKASAKEAYEVALAAAQAITEGSIPTNAYSNLQDVITENTLQDGTAAQYTTATTALNNATAIATPFIAPYAAWKKAKAPVVTISEVEYEEAEAGAHDALEASLSEDGFTTVEAITTATEALPEAVKTYIGKAEPKNEGEYFDITCLMANPDFEDSHNGWTFVDAPGVNWSNCEYYQKEFDINQTVTGLPTGSYSLSVQAFQRPGWANDVWTAYNNGKDNASSVLYINSVTSNVKNIMADAQNAPKLDKIEGKNYGDWPYDSQVGSEGNYKYVPNSQQGAKLYFDAGFYDATCAAVVEEADGGSLKLGFKSTKDHVDGDWTIFDNFRLYYYGSSLFIYYKQYLPQLIDEVEADKSNALYANVAGKELNDLNTALGVDASSFTTEQQYSDAIQAIKDAQAAYRAAYPGYDRLAAVITTATAIENQNAATAAQTAMGDAQTTAETALSTANGLFFDMLTGEINNAGSNVIGFEKDEYAPYKNIAATAALATANAIESVADATSDNLHAVITGLHAAQWVVNEDKVNAVYNGDFALSENDGAMTGWVTDHDAGLGGATHARAFVLESEDNNYDNLAAFGQGDGTRSCAFLRFDGTYSAKTTKYTYGTTDGYTMPLINSWYKFSAQLGGWGQVDKDITLCILNENDEEVATKTVHTPNTGIHAGGDAIDVNLVFNLNDADNYKLQILNGNTSADNAIVISNIELFSITAEEAQMLEKLVELEDLITEATQLSNSLEDGAIKTNLDAAIATAQGVKDAPESLNKVETAITDLQTAIAAAELANAQAKALAQVNAAREYDLPEIAQTLFTAEKTAIHTAINGAATTEAVAEQQALFQTLIATAEAIEASYKQYKEDVAIVKAMIASDAIDYGKEVNSEAKQNLETMLEGWEDVIQHATGYVDVSTLQKYESMADKFWRMPIQDGAIGFIGAVVVTKDKQLDITDVLLVNPDVTDFWKGDNNGGYNGDPNDHRAWGVQPDGWYNEQNGGNFQVMTNSAMDANGEVFMEYWSGTAASSGFVLCQKVNLPEGTYKMTGRVGVQQYDDNGETTNVTFSANDIDGTQIPYGPLVDGEIEFVQQQQDEVKIGLKAHEGNNARWMGINKIKLYKTTPKPFAIAENEDYDATQSGAGDVELTRTIKANVWNTIVLPFSLTYDELKTAFGDDVQVAQFSEVVNPNDATSSTIYFNTMETPALQANVPVLLKTSTTGTAYSFTGRTIVPVNGEAKAAGAGNFDFVGNYESQITIAAGNYFISANKLYSSVGKSKLAGTRAYIKVRENAQGARITGFSIDGVETTAIDGIFFEGNTGDKLYNLNGQQIERGQRGIYIKNGKKVVIR